MKKVITSLLALLCVFGSQSITMYAEENSSGNENFNEGTSTNTDDKDKEQGTKDDFGIALYSGNKGEK